MNALAVDPPQFCYLRPFHRGIVSKLGHSSVICHSARKAVVRLFLRAETRITDVHAVTSLSIPNVVVSERFRGSRAAVLMSPAAPPLESIADSNFKDCLSTRPSPQNTDSLPPSGLRSFSQDSDPLSSTKGILKSQSSQGYYDSSLGNRNSLHRRRVSINPEPEVHIIPNAKRERKRSRDESANGTLDGTGCNIIEPSASEPISTDSCRVLAPEGFKRVKFTIKYKGGVLGAPSYVLMPVNKLAQNCNSSFGNPPFFVGSKVSCCACKVPELLDVCTPFP